jgi:hypothetical protein
MAANLAVKLCLNEGAPANQERRTVAHDCARPRRTNARLPSICPNWGTPSALAGFWCDRTDARTFGHRGKMEDAMDVVTQRPTTVVDVHAASGVSWSSIAAGAVAAAALTLLLVALGAGLGLSPDKAYLASVIAARTGMSQADAERRVNEVVTETKRVADKARSAGVSLSLWLTASLLLGAFAASLAAVEGGQLRDGTWNDRILTPRTL